jgi:hypothetical protein
MMLSFDLLHPPEEIAVKDLTKISLLRVFLSALHLTAAVFSTNSQRLFRDRSSSLSGFPL